MNEAIFPEYLAFGKLNPESIRIEGKYRVADYYLLDEKVQEVKLAKDRALFIESCNGKSGNLSGGSTLERTVLNHFTLWTPSESPALEYLVQKTCSVGNIYFEAFSDDRTKQHLAYYPAGLLFIFRLPVLDEADLLDIYLFEPEIERCVHTWYTTALTTLHWSGEEDSEEITLLELIVPLHEVYNIAERLSYICLIQKEKKYRMIIQSVLSKATTEMQVFSQTARDPFQAYWIKYERLVIGKS